MKKPERRTVDDYLPKWLHSRFLSAINYIWEVKDQGKEETIKSFKSRFERPYLSRTINRHG